VLALDNTVEMDVDQRQLSMIHGKRVLSVLIILLVPAALVVAASLLVPQTLVVAVALVVLPTLEELAVLARKACHSRSQC